MVDLVELLGGGSRDAKLADDAASQLDAVLQELRDPRQERRIVTGERAALPEPSKPSTWSNIIPALITGVTFAAMALGIFVSLNSSMSEIQKTNRELSVQLATATANTANLSKQFDDWRGQNDKRDDQKDERLQRIEASLAKIDARLEQSGKRP